MRLRQLESFLAVADEGSFTRAARRMGVAQPSLSQQIRTLERELGGPLIDQGRLYVYMVTTLTPAAGGATNGATHLTARLQRNEGTSAEPIRCGSTGQLEEALRQQVEKQLAATR